MTAAQLDILERAADARRLTEEVAGCGGELVAAALSLTGWTQRRLAEELDVSQVHLSYVARGHKPMSVGLAGKLHDVTKGFQS